MPHLPASSALQRFRVIDLTQVRAGPTACRQLADWGADVIQVQMPEHMRGDDTLGGQDGSDYQYTHRNKRSITLNLKEAEGIATLKRLIAGADVVVENFRPDVKFRLGIDYETLAADQPAPGLRQHLGLRPDRPAGRAPRLRPDRAGHGRADVGHRHCRAKARCAWASRSPTCAPASSRRRASWSRCWSASLRQGPVAAHLAAGVHGLHDGLPDLALPDRRRGRDAGRQLPPDQHPDRRLQGARRLHEHRRVRLQDLGALLQHPRRARMDHRPALPRQGGALASTAIRSMPQINQRLAAQDRGHWIEQFNEGGVACGLINDMREVFDEPQVAAPGHGARRSSRRGSARSAWSASRCSWSARPARSPAPRRAAASTPRKSCSSSGFGRDDLARMKATGVF